MLVTKVPPLTCMKDKTIQRAEDEDQLDASLKGQKFTLVEGPFLDGKIGCDKGGELTFDENAQVPINTGFNARVPFGVFESVSQPFNIISHAKKSDNDSGPGTDISPSFERNGGTTKDRLMIEYIAEDTVEVFEQTKS